MDKKLRNTRKVKTPTILQMENVECGAASLAMILAYHGKYIPLEELRISCGVSRDGSKASNLLKAARKYGFQAKGFRKEPASLKTMEMPAILHWNFNHFLVLEGFDKESAYLNDPAEGRRKVSLQEFDESFTGVILTFEKTEVFEKSGQKPNYMSALASRLKGLEGALFFLVVTGFALVVPGFIVPTFSKIFIDDIIMNGRDEWLKILLIGMGLTAVIQSALTYLQQYYFLRMQTKISLSSSSQFLWHTLRLPVEFFSQRYAGDISSRMQSNDKVAELISGELAKTLLDVFVLIFYFFMMLMYNVPLSLIGLSVAIFNVVYFKFLAEKRADQNKKMMQESGKLYGISMSGLQIIETLKATGSESDFFAKWSGNHAKVVNAQQEIGVDSQSLTAIPGVFTAITNTLVLIVGGYMIMEGNMSVGTLVAFQGLMSSFLGPVNSLISMGDKIQTLQADMSRLDDVLQYPIDKQLQIEELEEAKEIEESVKEESYKKLDGYLEIKELSFGYNVLEPPLIDDFSLTITPGSRVALIGASGSGKSTVAKIITGIYEPWTGEICFDGKSRDSLPRKVITQSMAVVDQEISMFEGTIKENITLWDDSVPEDQVIKACKDACIHTDIIKRQGAYEHRMGEGGSNFSGGQKQRIEIARALATNPTILVLDEATSALDPKTEKIIDENIRRRGCTCIIIAHRLSTIRDCDEIIVMDQGKIVQRGMHDNLKDIEGPYRSLIESK